jgi:drug/metabolite transporter (DMT)-like permease
LLEPATAAILADIVAHQHIADTGWIGIALVAASVLLQTRAQPTPAGAP